MRSLDIVETHHKLELQADTGLIRAPSSYDVSGLPGNGEA